MVKLSYFLSPQELLRKAKNRGRLIPFRTTMASITITASIQRACSSSHHVTRKQQARTKPAYSLGTKQVMNAVTIDVEGQKGFKIDEQEKPASQISKSKDPEDKSTDNFETEPSAPMFRHERWKNGTWDLNMFVRNGEMDWDGLIVAEARRRKFLEMHPEACKNEGPVQFRSSIIPWWAWLMRTYLPEAELLNGRAAMIGFFMAYVVDALTGLDLMGQTGNFICKAGLFMTVIGIILFRKTQDFDNLRKLVDESTYYDKQWQASWKKDENAGSATSDKIGNS